MIIRGPSGYKGQNQGCNLLFEMSPLRHHNRPVKNPYKEYNKNAF